jgi:hypothetical protein
VRLEDVNLSPDTGGLLRVKPQNILAIDQAAVPDLCET